MSSFVHRSLKFAAWKTRRARTLADHLGRMLLGASLLGTSLPLPGRAAPLEELRTAEQVRRLPPREAERHYPVRLQGVLTFFDQKRPTKVFQFVQDETAGIYFYLSAGADNPGLATGQKVQIEGETGQGEFAPVVVAHRVQILGPGAFPPARPVSFEQLTSGQEDSQFVEVQGTVRSVQRDEETNYFSIHLTTGGGRITAYAAQLPVAQGEDLADRTIKVRGVCVTQFNLRRQLFDVRLLVPRREDLLVQDNSSHRDPFAIPAQPIGSLLQFSPEGTFGHRVKVSGTVIYRQNPKALYLEDGTEGIYVETQQPDPLLPGDRIEVLGFPANGEYTPMLQDAIFRKVASGPVPAPQEITTDEALKGTYDCRLVRVEATVVDRTRQSREEFLVLESGGFIFHAYLERKTRGSDFAYLQNGSKVAITGVCLIEKGSDWFAGEAWRANSFRLLMRSPGDIFVLRRPPWWTLERLSWALGLLGAVVLLALTWVAVLRRRVRQQTRIINQKLEAEAALKERYVELFENANDMVFTHDLTGRITSINKAGERLLQRRREELVSRNLLELVAEEDRSEAAQWLEQVMTGAELPAAEWDFLNASKQRLRLELSMRMIEQGGKRVEVEGIARDITERKHLEKELLEISNREQRRIGHDLHDGVCQQLVAIAYLTDVLANELQGQHAPAAAKAERIGGLINETISQTRSVARGLFPVRLEENGLVSALEELAANATNLFKTDCRFTCRESLPALADGAALHLYYIVQEAVSNAAKHGKAAHVAVTLTRAQDRWTLTVQDDGAGFDAAAVTGPGMGIRIMRYRARVIGATLDLKSRPGNGTQIVCGFYSAPRSAGPEP
jgi:PAS domain S-box-containing protein